MHHLPHCSFFAYPLFSIHLAYIALVTWVWYIPKGICVNLHVQSFWAFFPNLECTRRYENQRRVSSFGLIFL